MVQPATPAPAPVSNPAAAGKDTFEDLPPTQDAGGGNDEETFIMEAFEQFRVDGDDPTGQTGEAAPPPTPVTGSQTDEPTISPAEGEGTQPPVGGQPAATPPSVSQPPGQEPAGQTPAAAVSPGSQPGTQPQGPPAATTPSDPTQAFQTMQARIAEKAEEIIEVIATDPRSPYRLNETQAEELLNDPVKAFPKLAARVHVNAVQGVLGHIAQQLPAVVYGLLEAHTRQKGLEDRFYATWKPRGLDPTNDQHRATVNKIGVLFRQMNPAATPDEFTRMVGAQALVALGLVGKPQQKPNGQVRSSQPFAPAKAGHGGPPPAGNRNPWDLMAEVIQADDSGALDG